MVKYYTDKHRQNKGTNANSFGSITYLDNDPRYKFNICLIVRH
jgi:hypothetical protein